MGMNKTTVHFYPGCEYVCECGHIGKELTIGIRITEHPTGNKYGVPFIDPPICPNCKKEIEHIVWDNLQRIENK